ncbi:MAG: U32 family peptidase [Bacteroidales bacterium]|nr:U32 family peptidase [Bacteroidales bacterium]
MRQLELLAPARDIQIGIAAIDCGADAVYIAGPQFGARKAAGNSIEDIRKLCDYAHRFGVRIFVTLNTIIYDEELEEAYDQMLAVQDAGADAVIVQDMAILEMARKGLGNRFGEFRIPLHASTQCAIRTPQQAAFLESLGFSRLILERELSLEEIHAIRKATTCELEFFVHGALCVCYSGQCYLSEMISGRSANRGACIQACRSRYDLTDKDGNILIRDKALLSLKDYNLRNRIEDLAYAGVTSFKIEGRLKNESYVKNVVRDYSLALDSLVHQHPEEYERSSFGIVTGGFTPDTGKTFNRGYTELYIDGKRGKWASMDAAKSMGEEIGKVSEIGKGNAFIKIRPINKSIILNNGDGFSFVDRNGDVTGFRGDVCTGTVIRSRNLPEIFEGAHIFRNINAAFEKELEKQRCSREIRVGVSLSFYMEDGIWKVLVQATSEDGRLVTKIEEAGNQTAGNSGRMHQMFKSQIEKSFGGYRFALHDCNTQDSLPLMSASSINGLRRALAADLDNMTAGKKELNICHLDDINFKPLSENTISYKGNVANRISKTLYKDAGAVHIEDAYELNHIHSAELMRTRYCIRYEIGMCPKHHNAKSNSPLFLLNNGRRLILHFDCHKCEMTVMKA